MSADAIIKIIEGFPQYIQYIYPGYLTIYIYYFLRGWTAKDTKALILKSLAISSVYIIVINELIAPTVLLIWPGLAKYGTLLKTVALLSISVLIAYVSYTIIKSKSVSEKLEKIDIYTSFGSNEFDDIIDNEKGTWLCIYLKSSDVVYEGYIINREIEAGKRGYICLCSFYKYILMETGKPKTPYIEDHSNNSKEKIILYLDDIARIEVRDTDNE